VLIADAGNNVVRLVAGSSCASSCPYGLSSTTAGDVYTIAGTGSAGYCGDTGPATSAGHRDPQSAPRDHPGNRIAERQLTIGRTAQRTFLTSFH
jgi:hypothetical protein